MLLVANSLTEMQPVAVQTQEVHYNILKENLPPLSVPQPASAGSGEWLTALEAAGKAGSTVANLPTLH